LPTPTIGATTATQAGKFFNTVLYTGDGANPRSITGVGFQPDFVWGKRRSFTGDHFLMDSVRGTQRSLSSNTTVAEDVSSPNGLVQSFDSDGATFQGSSTNNNLNNSAITYVAWNWIASNATAVTNTSGTITSSVSANTTSGFSIVTYTGNSTSGATVGHGLGVTPSMVIVKGRNASGLAWCVYHISLGATQYLFLNADSVAGSYAGFWNNTSPSSTLFTLGNDDGTNGTAKTYVAYCFAPIAGYSAFSSYIGNGSADGPFVFTGFRPAYVVLKSSAGVVQVWIVVDSTRFPYNVVNGELYPNTTGAESSGQTRLDFVSNGFKLRTSDTAFNQSGCTYIYMAFASNPFKYSLAR
jgi:hypothetical protein